MKPPSLPLFLYDGRARAGDDGLWTVFKDYVSPARQLSLAGEANPSDLVAHAGVGSVLQ